jgi:hypothetical protein
VVGLVMGHGAWGGGGVGGWRWEESGRCVRKRCVALLLLEYSSHAYQQVTFGMHSPHWYWLTSWSDLTTVPRCAAQHLDNAKMPWE